METSDNYCLKNSENTDPKEAKNIFEENKNRDNLNVCKNEYEDNSNSELSLNEDTNNKVLTKDNIKSSNNITYSKGIISHKVEMKRNKNYEESSPFILNLFFCFYFPYICRIKPLREENVPYISKKDKSSLSTEKLKKNWDAKYEEYVKKKAEYEKNQEKNQEFFVIYSAFYLINSCYL